jgi:clan AA aspartic protease
MALIDTGSDGSIVPYHLLDGLRVPVSRQAYLRSFDGERSIVDIYIVDLEVNGERLPDVEVVASDLGLECILGRNVLNRMRLVLDGPRQSIEVQV